MKNLLLVFLVGIALFCKADGPPIDSTGKIFCKYIAIKLDSIQISHLQNHRWLELTTIQRKKLASLHLPKYIDVLSPFHNDCTCGQIYGIWFRKDSLAFVADDLHLKPYSDKEIFDWYNMGLNIEKSKNNLFIGTEGYLYFNNLRINENQIRVRLNDLGKTKNPSNYLIIHQPPLSSSFC